MVAAIAVAEQRQRELQEQFGDPEPIPPSSNPQIDFNSPVDGVNTGFPIGSGFGVDVRGRRLTQRQIF